MKSISLCVDNNASLALCWVLNCDVPISFFFLACVIAMQLRHQNLAELSKQSFKIIFRKVWLDRTDVNTSKFWPMAAKIDCWMLAARFDMVTFNVRLPTFTLSIFSRASLAASGVQNWRNAYSLFLFVILPSGNSIDFSGPKEANNS